MEKAHKDSNSLEVRAAHEGIDLSQLYERLALSPTDRLRRNFRMALGVEALKRAGEAHRDRIGR